MRCKPILGLIRSTRFRCWQPQRLRPWTPTQGLSLVSRLTLSNARQHSSLAPSSYEDAAFADDVVLENQVGVEYDNQLLAQDGIASLSACPGCGALAQTVEPDEAGYYSLKRNPVKRYLEAVSGDVQERLKSAEDVVFEEAMAKAGPQIAEELQLPTEDAEVPVSTGPPELPMCNRCHDLLHHHTGTPIHHPSVDSIHETISATPYKYNHIYHVVDAADFPLSLLPRIQKLLSLQPLRSKNRRAKQGGYRQGKKMDLSFIITRSDLLAPKKEQVDRLMPYLLDVLRDAIGRTARDVRLGNVRCVSAKRGWWTKELKADVWHRGGGQWMVGKVNVGKSKLFEEIFPKGKADDINFDRIRSKAQLLSHPPATLEGDHPGTLIVSPLPSVIPGQNEEEDSLLPPARLETAYPTMPTVSSLPGTTASPIRIPFGSGKGELIDLPGLARSSLTTHVRPEHHSALVMKSRPVPIQHNIKPGQSLLLGGLVRITSATPDIEILAYPFLPAEVKPHLTSTLKAASKGPDDAEKVARTTAINSLAVDGVSANLKSAGRFQLKWDVTKKRTGPLTSRDAVGLKPDRLPFQVLSAEILVESLGWVELVAQVRRRGAAGDGAHAEMEYPEVEVFTPDGGFVGVRRPMGAWALGRPLRKPVKKRRSYT